MFETNEFKKIVRIKEKKLNWLKENRNRNDGQSIAAFLDEILNERIKPNLFTKQKGKQH